MALPWHGTIHGRVAGLARLAAYLLCAGALLRGGSAHAQAQGAGQGYKSLPDVSQAINVKEPTPDQLFRLQSEAAWRQRLAAEDRKAGRPAPIFPPEAPPSGPFVGRSWGPQTVFVEPSYVCYGRLLFEQINAERYGWDLGPIHPLVATAKFYADVAVLPYKLATHPCCPCECSAGYCLPGSCIPLLLYPPECSASGLLAEAATIGVLLAVFP
jgi:hypothetical protein